MSETEAWRRGVALAVEHLAMRPADDGTMSVCLDRGTGIDQERPTFRMCLTCHWERGSARCPH